MSPRTPLRLTTTLTTALTTALAISPVASAHPIIAGEPLPRPRYEQVVADTASMVSDPDAVEKVNGKGLQLLNLTWEDTGRFEGSSVGPNISDVTIEVEAWRRGDQRRTYLMPVIRNDNFADKTGDVRLDKIWIPVGNQRGSQLRTVSLREVLAHPERYLSLPRRGRIAGGSLLAERDTHALVSAQHAFLPVPRDGKATFYPVVFNYQSSAQNPAVLTILVTRQGTSMTIIDNSRDRLDGSWGQRLYFNHDGQKAPLIAERLKDVQASGVTANGEDASTLGQDANLLMLIQVPLVHREARGWMADDTYGADEMAAPSAASGAPAPSAMKPMTKAPRGRESDVDVAVLGHGPSQGPFTEIDGLTIERDSRFPVRVTVQFYQATSNGVVSQADVDRMAAQIARVYESADYVGSLVVPSPRDRARPTNWRGARRPPTIGWWWSRGFAVRPADAN